MRDSESQTQACIEPEVASLVLSLRPIANYVVGAHFAKNEANHAGNANNEEDGSTVKLAEIGVVTAQLDYDLLILLVCGDLTLGLLLLGLSLLLLFIDVDRLLRLRRQHALLQLVLRLEELLVDVRLAKHRLIHHLVIVLAVIGYVHFQLYRAVSVLPRLLLVLGLRAHFLLLRLVRLVNIH